MPYENAERQREYFRNYFKNHKDHIRINQAKWREKNREKIRAYAHEWHLANPEMVLNLSVKKYGLTAKEYARLLANQGGVCAICGERPAKYRLNVDHNHKTGAVRALICHSCNRGIGYLRDSPEVLRKAANYIEAHEAK